MSFDHCHILRAIFFMILSRFAFPLVDISSSFRANFHKPISRTKAAIYNQLLKGFVNVSVHAMKEVVKLAVSFLVTNINEKRELNMTVAG